MREEAEVKVKALVDKRWQHNETGASKQEAGVPENGSQRRLLSESAAR